MSATCVLAGTTGVVSSACFLAFVVSLPSVDSLFEPSLAFAVTSVPSATLSAGIVTFPVAGSTFTPSGAFSGSVHVPSSPFVAVSVCGFPAWSLYAIVTLFVSLSVGGVTVTEPSLFAVTPGFPGAVISFEFAVASGDPCVPACSFAFTSSFLDSMLSGIVTIPVSLSIFMDGSVPPASAQLPSASFFAVTFIGLTASPNDISSVSDSLLFGDTFTLPSGAASTVGALSFSRTVSACESCPTFWLSPVPCFTVTNPSLLTVTVASFGKSGFAFLTAAITLSFSSCVKFVLSTTSVFSGSFKGILLSLGVACLTVLSAAIVLSPADPIGTVTLPSSATWISSSVKSKSGFAALTASFTACFSCSVRFFVLATGIICGSFNVLPALSNGFTVSLPSKVPFLVPSVTVTLPLLSTVTTASALNLPSLAFLTASATLSLSSLVKSVVSFTSVFSGAVKSRIVSFCTTVWSGVNEPTLPFWLIFTDPSSFTVMSSSVKFLSGFAVLIASLTACFSLSVNAFAFSTLTSSFGGLKVFSTNFWVIVLSGANVPVLPSFVTVTVPSSSTTTSSFVKFKSGFALITAASTASCSGSVNDVISITTVFSGLFKVKGVLSVCSQTA